VAVTPSINGSFRPVAGRQDAKPKSFDQQALERIEIVRAEHDRLRFVRQKAIDDSARLLAEQDEALKEIRDKFNAESLDALRSDVSERRRLATEIIDTYAEGVEGVRVRLLQLESQV
jgi:hypothetical protein